MNVASLDLCKALYEVSGWDDEELEHWFTDMPTFNAENLEAWKSEMDKPTFERIICPKYSLGYLLRKLPKWKLIDIGTDKAPAYKAICSICVRFADTPEDAACKLAIELFKQNILTKDTR